MITIYPPGIYFYTHFIDKTTEVQRSNGDLLIHDRERIENSGLHDSKILAFFITP